jgi:uncharacterized protein YegP (UPF0339 family)
MRLVTLMTTKYQLYKDKARKYRFRLIAENGQIVAVGEAYPRKASCLKGIESVKKNSSASIEDTTVEGSKIPFPKYQVFTDKAGEFRFNLSASNGEVIASSEGYSSKESCLDGIKSVQRIGNSETEDLSIEKKENAKEPTTPKEVKPEPQAIQPTEKNETEPTIPAEPEQELIVMKPTEIIEKEITAPIKPEPEPIGIQLKEKIETEPTILTEPEPESPIMKSTEKIEASIPATPTAPFEETPTIGNEVKINPKTVSPVTIAIMIIGLIIGIILIVFGLGAADSFGIQDVTTKSSILLTGEIIVGVSILFFFAKK